MGYKQERDILKSPLRISLGMPSEIPVYRRVSFAIFYLGDVPLSACSSELRLCRAEGSSDRQFDVDAPDRCWVTNIKYIKTMEGSAYLAVVIDLYSRMLIGWSLQSRPTTELVLETLLAAVWRR